MRRSSLRLFVAGVVTALVVPVTWAATAEPSAAVSACTSTQAPVGEGAQAVMTIGCTTDNADVAPNPIIFDHENARWHSGAIREFTICSWSIGSYVATCSLAQSRPAGSHDINHAVTGSTTKDGIGAGAFVISASAPGTFTLSQPFTVAKSGNGKIWVENATARNVRDDPTTTGTDEGLSTTGTTAVTAVGGSTVANFTAADADPDGAGPLLGSSISSECIAPGTTIVSVTNTSSATMSTASTCTQTSKNGSINSGVHTNSARVLQDVVLTAGSTTITSATADFDPSDVGLYVKGIGLSFAGNSAYIASVTNPTTAVLTNSLAFEVVRVSTKDPIATLVTGTANGVVQIGRPSLSAPSDGGKVSSLLTQIQLDPGFVEGSRACAAGDPSGFTLAGTWYNPGKFLKMSFLIPTNIVPDVSGAIGQIVYKTSVTTFAGYVVKDSSDNYRIELPFVPTGIANCAGADIAAGYSFDGGSSSQGLIPTGLGRPGTATVRGIEGNPTGASVTTDPDYSNNEYTDEVQTLNLNGTTSGNFRIVSTATAGAVSCGTSPDGTLSLKASATALKASDVSKAIRSSGCPLEVRVTGANGGPFQVTYSQDGFAHRGAFAGLNVPQASVIAATPGAGVTALVGGTPSFSTTTTGATVTHVLNGTDCTVTRPATFGFPCGLG